MTALLHEESRPQTGTLDSRGSAFAWKVVLINCDCHSFDEVERQLMKAVRCTLSMARKYSWEVHHRGAAVVYQGHLERCEAVAMVLEDANLVVQLAQ
ncbi:MAG: ATP-dependent Clp protease adaptor ClpS [Elusimicrobia bacterium]|nr:ATP-dependent Clp protease adaptor ClpS [Elusimicrobiota bacterium]